MNQDSSFPPMLPPSTELGALLFAILPCLQETYRPLASFAYHMTELTKLKSIPAVPNLSGLSGIEALITDKDILLRSLSFYGKMFRMPLLSTIATLLQGFQFYQAYKDILPGLASAMGGGNATVDSPLGTMAGLFSGLGGLGNGSSDLFSVLGGLSPDLLSSLLSGFSGGFGTSSQNNTSQPPQEEGSAPPVEEVPPVPSEETLTPVPPPLSPEEDTFDCHSEFQNAASSDTQSRNDTADTLYDSLYSFLTPEQQKIYEQLMHTD